MRLFHGLARVAILAALMLAILAGDMPASAKSVTVNKAMKKKKNQTCKTRACIPRAKLRHANIAAEVGRLGALRSGTTLTPLLGERTLSDAKLVESMSVPATGLDAFGVHGNKGIQRSGAGAAGIGTLGSSRVGYGGGPGGGGGSAIGGMGTIRMARPSIQAAPGSDSVLAAHIRTKEARLERCYRDLLVRKPGWKGVVVASLHAEAGGDVSAATIEGAPDGGMRDCMATAVLGPVARPDDAAIDGRLELSLDPRVAP